MPLVLVYNSSIINELNSRGDKWAWSHGDKGRKLVILLKLAIGGLGVCMTVMTSLIEWARWQVGMVTRGATFRGQGDMWAR